MKKYIKYLIIIFLFFTLVITINFLLKPNINDQMREYLINNDYVIETQDNNNWLLKSIDDNTINYFSIDQYTLMQNHNEYDNNVMSSLNQTYDFKTHNLSYKYRIQYSDNINVIFSGNLINDNFSCEKEFSTTSLNINERQNICNLIKIKVNNFLLEANTLFNHYSFIKHMEESKIDN